MLLLSGRNPVPGRSPMPSNLPGMLPVLLSNLSVQSPGPHAGSREGFPHKPVVPQGWQLHGLSHCSPNMLPAFGVGMAGPWGTEMQAAPQGCCRTGSLVWAAQLQSVHPSYLPPVQQRFLLENSALGCRQQVASISLRELVGRLPWFWSCTLSLDDCRDQTQVLF